MSLKLFQFLLDNLTVTTFYNRVVNLISFSRVQDKETANYIYIFFLAIAGEPIFDLNEPVSFAGTCSKVIFTNVINPLFWQKLVKYSGQDGVDSVLTNENFQIK